MRTRVGAVIRGKFPERDVGFTSGIGRSLGEKSECPVGKTEAMNIENEGESHDVIDNKGSNFLSHDVIDNTGT